ncbi:hypothetical protein [Isoptericola sp. NPDC056134]|uniref:hypothetical protein n=1 Tax=Isoptericola sp. NPDC056134 TaxID=3345723 RepID=UPI0035E63F35
MSTNPARALLDEADRHHKTARGADRAMTKIRLGERPQTRRGLLGFWREDAPRPCEFDHEETAAIYEALAIVRDRSHEAAAKVEARVTVTEEATR